MAFATVRDRYTQEQIEGFYAEGFWGRPTMFEALEHQVAQRGDKVFITDDTTGFTYRQVHDDAVRIAAGLSRLGVGRGDSVAIQMPSWAEFAALAMAINRVGAIIVPAQPIYRTDEVRHMIATANVKAVFTATEYRGFDHAGMWLSFLESAPSLEHVITIRGEGPAGTQTVESLIEGIAVEEAQRELPAAAGPDDAFAMVFTSGTTSQAKGCLHTFNTLATSARIQAENYRYTEDDVQFGPSPLTHTTGLVTSIILPLLYGAATHVMERWNPELALEQIREHRCSVTVNASTFLQTLLEAYDPARHDASTMRVWTLAGAPIPASLVEKARQALPNLSVLSLYGRTENTSMTMCTLDDEPERSLTSDGRAFRGQEIVILGPGDEILPAGKEGEIAFRGAMVLLEYVGEPEKTAESFTAEGYSKSGDLGILDEEGYLRVTGRLKDIIIRGGYNISVRQVEDLLAAHEAVGKVAVVAMPDETMGERACCYLVPAAGHDPLTLDEIRDYLLGHGLAIQKVPERLEVVDEVPTTPTGKIQKNVLRAEIARKVLGVPDLSSAG
ncbi:short chain acyl-CoA synthetase [Citricoccus zhacaiensis]|uniref:Short chain acyl-CoA synthetase n=1 Tax=Citricoccus zhacaiensis TaxID=489142 RepID=A0ABQ2LUT0_9MICC|nr:AMP-binding protein [Citricoccus zhacaiensis]GGO43589.1 short chain acyl-CoA synthetase [Citricoccus zhacaiensis]